ncbi:MAG: tyrosine-type recombinase/integrase, partial [Lachnospiraceae bacterium]|nr:tyrosine-type recombinase/integrase [Lachnospiraceae bacterium]
KLEVGQTTWIKDKYYYETYISPLIGNRNIQRLTIDDGYRFLEGCIRIHPGMTRKYWGNLRCMLNQFFQYCIDRRYIDQNPWISMKPKKDLFAPPKFTRDGDTVFTKTEQIAVCDLAKKEAVRTRRSEPLGIVLLFNLGLRDGELCALKWGDMERTTTHEYIHVQREMVSNVTEDGKAKGVTILPHCKTPAGDRRLLLNAEARETLKQIRQYNQDRGILCTPDDFVFLRVRKGKIEHITTRSIDSRLRRYCRETGMKVEKSPHDIRRTVLTNLYHAGMPLKKVQEFAGHSSLKQTMDYIRVSDDDIDTMQFIESLSVVETPADNIVRFRHEA